MQPNTPPPPDDSPSEQSHPPEEDSRGGRGRRPSAEAKAARQEDAEAMAAARDKQQRTAHERKARTKRLIERGGVDAKYGSPGAAAQERLYERLLDSAEGRELLRECDFEETEAWPAHEDDEWVI